MITPYSNIISVTTLEALLLDTYSGAAAAYSLRKLSASYTGSAIKVRRSVGSPSEKDIGFVNNELDVADLESFCSGTDGFVVTWYDQSGNGRNATQSTAANQPQIVSGGSVILDNGKPSLQFDGSNDAFTTSVSFTQPFFVSLVVKNTKASNTYPYYLDSNSTGRFLLYVEDTNGIVASAAYVSGKLLISGINKTVQSLISVLYNTTSSFLAIDGTIAVSGGIETNNINSPIYIGSRNTNAQNIQGTYQELIFWDSNQSSNRTGIETNINANYQIYWDGSQTSLLDTYSGSAAAYSLRALSSAYTGPLVRVRRADNNAEQDIYAKYDGTLNVDALESFCSGTDGFVKTWYDQSGNGYDAEQTTIANQPQIVSSGSVILENGKPSLQFDGSDDYFNLGDILSGESILNNYSVVNVITGTLTGFFDIYNKGIGAPGEREYFLSQQQMFVFNENTDTSTAVNTGMSSNTQYLVNSGYNTSYVFVGFNSNTLTIGSSQTVQNQTSNLYFGTSVALNRFTEMKYQECIFYPSDQSSNRTGIETNINDFYSIY